MPERKPIPKRIRFEVFKRDSFTCQYCGAHPPGVILHVDHIVAVASGGQNEIDNLITACEPCNAGKGAVALDRVPHSLADKAARIEEIEAQIAGYSEVIRQRALRINADINRVDAIYQRARPGWELSENSRRTIARFLERLTVYDIVEAMEIACERMDPESGRVFPYFCGICWNKIRGNERAGQGHS